MQGRGCIWALWVVCNCIQGRGWLPASIAAPPSSSTTSGTRGVAHNSKVWLIVNPNKTFGWRVLLLVYSEPLGHALCHPCLLSVSGLIFRKMKARGNPSQSLQFILAQVLFVITCWYLVSLNSHTWTKCLPCPKVELFAHGFKHSHPPPLSLQAWACGVCTMQTQLNGFGCDTCFSAVILRKWHLKWRGNQIIHSKSKFHSLSKSYLITLCALNTQLPKLAHCVLGWSDGSSLLSHTVDCTKFPHPGPKTI